MARTPRSGAPTNRPRPTAMRASGKPAAVGGAAMARVEADAPKRRTPPLQFIREVRAEGRKITWTSWKETWITSVMVLILVAISTIFLFTVDFIIRNGIQQLFRLPEYLS